MTDIMQVADNADMIINGYAFTQEKDRIRILNLNNPTKAVSLKKDGAVMETSMDDIEIRIVKDYLLKNMAFMEEQYAEIL